MTKTTKGYAISHNDKTITLTKAYAKKANIPGTREFKELTNLHKNFPDYDIVMRTLTPNEDKEKHPGLTRVHSVTKKALKSLHFPTKYAIITARE